MTALLAQTRLFRKDPDVSTFDLERFISAQERVYSTVVGELRNGMKASHWMWFIFPQIDGLGSSPTARHYAIRSLEEAIAYLTHPILGSRLHRMHRARQRR